MDHPRSNPSGRTVGNSARNRSHNNQHVLKNLARSAVYVVAVAVFAQVNARRVHPRKLEKARLSHNQSPKISRNGGEVIAA